MVTTTNLGITLVEQAQAQKEVTINQAFSVLDAFVGRSVVDKDLATPPTTPTPSALYIVAASPTGAWAGKATQLAYFDQIWRFIAPQTGMKLYVQDEALEYQFTGAAWSALTAGSGDMAKAVYDAANINQQLVGVSAAQTLTNKTLTAPIISSISNTGTVTLPTSTDTLIGRTTTDTLTNKTIDGAANTLTVRLASDVTGNLSVTNLASGTGASATTYWRGDGTWATPAGGGGSGNVVGAATTTTNAIGRWGNTAGTSLVNSGVLIDASNNITGAGSIASAAHIVTSNALQALAVGATGATNPALTVDASTASSATGLLVKSAAAAGGLALSVQSSGVNENLTLNAKGSGTIAIGSVSTGAITLSRATTVSGALTQTGGASSFTTSASSTAATVRYAFAGAADTALTASAEAPNVYFNLGQIRQHATGALALQRDCRITPSTHSFVAASTLTDAAGVAIDGAPIAGANATITNAATLSTLSRAVNGGGSVTNSYGIIANANTGATNNFSLSCVGGKVLLPAATTGYASLTLPHGTEPTTPVNGDIWTTTSGVFTRINGATQQLGASSGSGSLFGVSTANFSKTSDVTLALVTGCSVALAAGKRYAISGWVQTTSAGTGGIRAALVANSGLVATAYSAECLVNGGVTAQTRAASLGSLLVNSVSVSAAFFYFYGYIDVSVGGNLQLHFAQSVSNATASVALQGTTLKAELLN